MKSDQRLERLAREVRLAAGRLAPLEQGPEARRRGQLLTLRQTAGWPVQWLVLEAGDGGGGELLLAPADACPLLGPGDLRVTETASESALTVRAAFALRWSASELSRALVSGEVAEREAKRARALSEQAPSSYDLDPEYVDWLEDVVLPARAALAGLAEPSVDTGVDGILGRRHWRVAALVLLGLSLVLAGALWRSERAPRVTTDQVLGLPLAFLAPADQRGEEATTVVIPAGTPRFALILSLDPVVLRSEYRLEIRRADEAEPFWQAGPVARRGQPWIGVELSSERFAPGDYRLDLLAAGEGAVRLTVYLFRVESQYGDAR